MQSGAAQPTAERRKEGKGGPGRGKGVAHWEGTARVRGGLLARRALPPEGKEWGGSSSRDVSMRGAARHITEPDALRPTGSIRNQRARLLVAWLLRPGGGESRAAAVAGSEAKARPRQGSLCGRPSRCGVVCQHVRPRVPAAPGEWPQRYQLKPAQGRAHMVSRGAVVRCAPGCATWLLRFCRAFSPLGGSGT